MFIRVKASQAGTSHRIQIVETVKEGKRTRQHIVKHIGFAHSDDEVSALRKIAVVEMEMIRQARSGGALFDATENLLDKEELSAKKDKLNVNNLSIEKVQVEGPDVVYGKIFDDLGFGKLLDEQATEVLRTVISQRTEEPESKLALSERISERQEDALSVDRIYRMMDKLAGKTDAIRDLVRKNAERHSGGKIDVVFYDCTTLYFESTIADELRNFGFSKDHKYHQTQVVLAVATTGRGLPVDFQLFPGNTAETSTLIQCLERWKTRFPIGSVTFVADRGLFSIKNLFEIKEAGYDFLVACPLRKLDKKNSSAILDHFHPQQKEYAATILPLQMPLELSQRFKDAKTGNYSERSVEGILSVDFSESRARKDASDREKLVKKIRSKVGTGPSNPKDLISNSGYKKFVAVSQAGKVEIDESKIAADKLWDGLHGILSSRALSPEEIRSRYRHLWTIEETFRISKTDLEIRPIYHWKKSRIVAHVSICYMSLAIVRHLEHCLRERGITMSVKKVNESLSKLQSCVVQDSSTGKKFKLPTKLSIENKQILDALQISYKSSVTSI